MTQDPVRTPLVLQPKIWNRQLMYPRYLFDSSITITFRQEFNKWWKKNYAYVASPVEHVQVRIVTNGNRTLENFFMHKKPPREILIKTTEENKLSLNVLLQQHKKTLEANKNLFSSIFLSNCQHYFRLRSKILSFILITYSILDIFISVNLPDESLTL